MQEQAIIDRLVRSRRRTLSLQVSSDGQLIVRAPKWGSLADINKFVSRQLPWIQEKQRAARAARSQRIVHRYQTGEEFLLLGELYLLTVVPNSQQALTLDFGGLLMGDTHSPSGARVFERWYREQARRVLSERLEMLASVWGFSYSKLRVSGARTRWGSCSSKGNLSFSWRLIMAPLWVVDYVVMHELAHLKHHNHSRQFWNEVQRMCPDFKSAVRWLKTNHLRLTLDE